MQYDWQFWLTMTCVLLAAGALGLRVWRVMSASGRSGACGGGCHGCTSATPDTPLVQLDLSPRFDSSTDRSV